MNLEESIKALIQSGWRSAGVLAGGGSGAMAALLAQPGASQFVIDIQVPYQREALIDYLGAPVTSCASSITAAFMARRAFERARRYAPDEPRLLGWACSAALYTQPARRGADRAHLAVCTKEKRYHRYMACAGSRQQQEQEVAEAIVALLCEVIGARG